MGKENKEKNNVRFQVLLDGELLVDIELYNLLYRLENYGAIEKFFADAVEVRIVTDDGDCIQAIEPPEYSEEG